MASYLSGNTTVMSEEYFTKDVVIVTDEGDLVGINACREYYANYLIYFSEIKWAIIDAFGQGDRLVKHLNFKGRCIGMFFGIALMRNDLDLSGKTIVTLVDGKIAKEDDFFCTKSVIDQLTESNV
ncbi:MAG: putative ester cyclase [Sediminicola sp.]|jgi:predicted ester cyclase